MPASRNVVNVWIAASALALLAFPAGLACSSGDSGGAAGSPATGGPGGGMSSTGGSASTAGANATGGSGVIPQGGITSTGGSAATGGNAGAPGTGGNSGGIGVGGTGGATTGGVQGMAGTAAGGMSGDPCDTPPWRPLNVTAAVGEHVHGKAGLDTRAKTMLGKLVIDYGVAGGGYSSFLAKRGYHSIGAPGFTECAAPDLGGDRTRVGTCRMGEIATTTASIITTLNSLQSQYPEEDWGYFLTQDGKSLRWEDVATSGISHGATTAAVAGRINACVWRVVSRSGPRDNTCGLGSGQCSAPLSTPSYDPACADADVAAWLDQPSKTPMDRFYAIVGMSDGQCGDITFNMHRTKYLGVPTIFDVAGADFSNTHQFLSSTQGHYDFLAASNGAMNTPAVLEIAFGIPAENRNPNF
jgi:hypothetical protein